MRVLGVAVFLTASSAAAACPPVVLSPELSDPQDGSTDAALNGAIVVGYVPADLNCFDPIQWSFDVRDAATNASVAGKHVPWNATATCTTGKGYAAWMPISALAPSTAYVAEVTANDQVLTTTFTTSKNELSAMTVEGTLDVQVGAVEKETITCSEPQLCGGGRGCSKTTELVVRARLTLTAAHGGQEAPGYDAVAVMRAESPVTFPGPGFGYSADPNLTNSGFRHFAAGAKMTFDVPLRQGTKPYSPCFSVNIWDAAGGWVEPEPVCLPELDPAVYLADAGAADAGVVEAGAPPEAGVVPVAPSSGGCGVAPRASGDGVALLLGALALLGLTRGGSPCRQHAQRRRRRRRDPR